MRTKSVMAGSLFSKKPLGMMDVDTHNLFLRGAGRKARCLAGEGEGGDEVLYCEAEE